MLHNILVPLDGSPASEAALPFARALAARASATLSLVRAVPGRGLSHDAVGQQRAVSAAEDYLAGLAATLEAAGLRVQTGVPFGASPATWILEEIELRQASLVVMASHDRVGPDRWLHGSVAEAVVNRTATPVLLVREVEGPPPAPRFDEQQPVLVVPLDGSELAESALPMARELARLIAARVVLVGVVPPVGHLIAVEGGAAPYSDAAHERAEVDAQAYLEGAVARLGADAVAVETCVRTGEPAVEIARVAAEYLAAAVVMATHGRTGVIRTILGSVAGGVLHRSPTPVLLMHPADLRPAEEPLVREALAGAP
jgi:nucleotide-binding universal stress UspA family protein